MARHAALCNSPLCKCAQVLVTIVIPERTGADNEQQTPCSSHLPLSKALLSCGDLTQNPCVSQCRSAGMSVYGT